MITNLEEIYTNSESVVSIINKFANMTVNQMKISSKVIKNIDIMTSEIIGIKQLDKELIGDMNYIEFITMLELSLNKVFEEPYPDGQLCTKEVYNLFLYKVLLVIINKITGVVIPARLLMEMPLDKFLECMDDLEKKNKNVVLERLALNRNNMLIEIRQLHGDSHKDNITLRETLLEIEKRVFKEWQLINMSETQYCERILNELKLFKNLFVEKFLMAFPTQTNEFEVVKKYAERK